jgi:hypothetical protein
LARLSRHQQQERCRRGFGWWIRQKDPNALPAEDTSAAHRPVGDSHGSPPATHKPSIAFAKNETCPPPAGTTHRNEIKTTAIDWPLW